MPKSDIPFGSEFGPNQVDLAMVLQLASAHAGDGAGFTAAIARLYGWPLDTAKNTRLGLQSYQLLAADRLTAIGERLLSLIDDPPALYDAFARHILINLHGLEVVTAIDDMTRVGEAVSLASLSAYLRPLGLYVPTTGTHLSKLRGWLAKAGIFTEERGFASLNMARVRTLLGLVEDAEIDILAALPVDQRSFLKALANLPMGTIPDTDPILASDVVTYASTVYGTTFNEKGLVRVTLQPLQDAGFITINKPPKATGGEAGTRRIISGKSTLIYRTEKFANDCLVPLIDSLAGTGLAVRQLMRKPLREILDEIASPDKNIKGRGLEALAFYFTRLLDLEVRAWRHRSKDTGGAEVEVIADGTRVLYSRWQIYCHNRKNLTLDNVAIRVGLSPSLNTNALLIMTSGRPTSEALQFIEDARRTLNIPIALLLTEELRALARADSPKSLVNTLLWSKSRQTA